MTTKTDQHVWVGPVMDEHGFLAVQPLGHVHNPKQCAGSFCALHHPSKHHMREWPMMWRQDAHVFDRICLHAEGHPDPDDVAYQLSIGHDWAGFHHCDGCCTAPG